MNMCCKFKTETKTSEKRKTIKDDLLIMDGVIKCALFKAPLLVYQTMLECMYGYTACKRGNHLCGHCINEVYRYIDERINHLQGQNVQIYSNLDNEGFDFFISLGQSARPLLVVPLQLKGASGIIVTAGALLVAPSLDNI